MSASLSIRNEFPALDQEVNGRPLVYLDNAATCQSPRVVLDVLAAYSGVTHANVHRGVHMLSQQATDAYESARTKIQLFLGAESSSEIVLTKGCTEAINLVAQAWGRSNLKPGDRVLVSEMEHHANIVPWQLVAEQTGARVVPIPVSDDGVLDLDAYEGLLREHQVRMVAVKHVCNALGTINPVEEITKMAHAAGALVLIDGAQALAHQTVNVSEIGCDFYAIAAHKCYGPMGVGSLYARRQLLEDMPPYQAGGDMIRTVTFEKSTFNVVPHKFEAGTPNMPGVIAFGAALDWLGQQDQRSIHQEEVELAIYATSELEKIPGVKVLGPRSNRTAIVSFVTDYAHPHDIGTVLDQFGVAIRTGHHCCMPLMGRLKVPSTARASFAAYSSKVDISVMIEAMQEVHRLFS